MPDETAGPHDDREVVETYDRARSSIGLARELWKLIGGTREMQHIDEGLERAARRETWGMDGEDIAALIGPIEALPEALRRAFSLDEHDRMTMAQVEDLRTRIDTLDLEANRGDELVVYGLAEGIADIEHLGKILRRARDENLHILFD